MLNLKKDESEINECNLEENTTNAASTEMSGQWCTEEEVMRGPSSNRERAAFLTLL